MVPARIFQGTWLKADREKAVKIKTRMEVAGKRFMGIFFCSAPRNECRIYPVNRRESSITCSSPQALAGGAWGSGSAVLDRLSFYFCKIGVIETNRPDMKKWIVIAVTVVLLLTLACVYWLIPNTVFISEERSFHGNAHLLYRMLMNDKGKFWQQHREAQSDS